MATVTTVTDDRGGSARRPERSAAPAGVLSPGAASRTAGPGAGPAAYALGMCNEVCVGGCSPGSHGFRPAFAHEERNGGRPASC